VLPYSPWLAWLIPIIGSLSVPIIAKINGKLRDWLSFTFVATSSIFTFSMLPDVFNGRSAELQVQWIPYFNLSYGVLIDPLSVFMASLVSFIGALIMLYSIGYMAHEEGLTRYYFFMLLFIGGMIGLVMANNFFQLYIFWEIVGLCSYALIGFWYKKPEAARAGMKAFIVTRIGDVCLLLGILILYLNTGQLTFSAVRNSASPLSASLLTTVALLFFGGAIGKSAQVPLFVWLPDAMEGPTTVSALIHAATMVKAGVYLVARTAIVFPSLSSEYLLAVAGVGAVTAFMAATMALATFDIKRVLAYSTISQIGYMMFSLGLGTSGGWLASQFHLMSHALFKALLFLCAGAVIHVTGTRDMRQMGGLKRYMPVTYVTFIIGALSLSGVPPFNGFWSKDLILEECFKLGGYMGSFLFFVGTSTAIITVAYAIRMTALTFMGEEPNLLKGKKLCEAPNVMTVPLIVLASTCVASGFLQPYFIGFMSQILPRANELSIASIEALPLTVSLIALIAGGLPAYIIYVRRSVSPETFTKGRFSRYLYKILANGYYFDSFYNYVFVKGVSYISNWSRKLQTGILNVNMIAFIAAFLSLLSFFFAALEGGV